MAVKAREEVTLSCIVDIEAVYRYYLLQSSTLDVPPKPTVFPPTCREDCETCTNSSHYKWSDTEPTFNKTTTSCLYTVECTLFCDGTWEYTSVSLSSSYEAAKEAYQEALNAKKVATNYMDFGSDYGDGLVIGDLTASILGRNAYIDSEGFYIRNGTTVLASFDEDDIYLGNETLRATVHLCGDRGVIEALEQTDGYDETWEELSLRTPHCLSLQSDAYISLGTSGVDVWNGNVTNAYLRVVSAFPWSDTETPVPFVEMYCNEYGETEQAASLKLTPSGVSIEGSLSVEYSLFVTGQSNFASSAVFDNGKSIYFKDTSGTARISLTINSSNNLLLGYSQYTTKGGNTDIYGGGSASTLGGVRLLVPNLTDGGSVGAVLWTSTSSVPAYFRPTTSAKAALGSTSYKWYRLYQSESSVSTSDRREKENIKALKNVRKHRKKKDGTTEEFDVYTELFDRLEPVEYNFIEGEKRKDFGLIAQDVLEVMADLGLEENELDLVHHDTWIDEETGEEKDGYGIAYENLIAVLIHEVQKLKATVKYK